MKLTDGKMYITRDGRSIGPMKQAYVLDLYEEHHLRFIDTSAEITRMGWLPDGSFIDGCQSPLDLVRTARRAA
jgi:hypothetical protein